MLRPIVFARYPEPGRAKTRLIPALGAEGAADLHRQLVERTLARLACLGPVLAYTGAAEAAFRRWLGPAIPLVPQAAGDLGARLAAALGGDGGLVVGSDIPDIDAPAVRAAAVALHRFDLVLGPAEDGGFWLIALRRVCPRLFAGVVWGGSGVLTAVERNADEAGLTRTRVHRLADLDRPEDLRRWPELSPGAGRGPAP